MAVISITDTSKMEFYRGGNPGASVVVGYESGYRRVARYAFTVPAPGASSITARVNGPSYVDNGGREQAIRFYIGTSPTSHVNAGPDAEYMGEVTVSASGRVISLSADIALVPEQTYYLWFFPSTDYFGWYYWSLNCTITTYGGVTSNPTTSAASVEMGNPVTLYTNRAGDLTHKLEYTFGNAKGVIAENVGDSCTWTPLIDLARQIPEATEGVAVITCTTYLDGEPIGQPTQTTVTLQVPESIVPTASATWTDVSGAHAAVGVLAQNVSKLTVNVSGTGSYGSSVNSAAVTLGGKAYNGGVITGKGDLELVVTVKDSRGRTGSEAYPIYVAEYAVPVLKLSASRCTADGTADDFGEYGKITVTGSVTAIGNGNTAELTVDYGSTPETQAVTPSGFTWSKIVPVSSTTTLPISATLTDKLKSTPRDMVLSVGYATADYLKGGKGIAFGTTATQEGFTCAMPARFTGGVTGITAAMVGAVRTGFGLGESASYFVTNADNISGSGWYAVNVGTPDANWWLVFASVRNGDYQHQTAYRVYDGETAERYKANGVWGEWEYLNPPMALGVEYRTVERWNNKAVYTKLLNFGTATDYTTVSLGIAGTCSIIRQEGTLTNAGVVIPYNEFGGSNSFNILTAVNEGEWRCTFRVGSNYSGRFTLALQVWYVKT